jgi:hypothetical protein
MKFYFPFADKRDNEDSLGKIFYFLLIFRQKIEFKFRSIYSTKYFLLIL